ncbi:MAG: hypothetical protein HC889_00570 [Synechococcaceae cyanobacterium SM1_2_3]|nr:hypothetical protein [Synechococcaceae cyanobacterium SM1_2_3]
MTVDSFLLVAAGFTLGVLACGFIATAAWYVALLRAERRAEEAEVRYLASRGYPG